MAMDYTTTAAVLALCSLFVSIFAKDYTVGDSNGWASGVDYTQWTSDKTFVVGDNLIFNYSPQLHTMLEVSSADYSSCSSTATPLNADTNSGSSTISLTSPGTHYFVCGTPSHCSGGMKLAVLVSAATSPTTPSQLPTPTTPTTTPTTTTTPYSTTPSSILPPGRTDPTTFSYGSSAPAGLLGLSSVVIGGAMTAAAVALLS